MHPPLRSSGSNSEIPPERRDRPGLKSTADSNVHCTPGAMDYNRFPTLKEKMTDPFAAMREVVSRFEEVLREREQELTQFRAQAAAYEKFLRDQIDKDSSILEILKEDIKSREEAIVLPPDLGTSNNTPPNRASRQRSISQTERIRTAARRILAHHGGTLTRAEIRAHMEEEGVVVESADFLELIRAALKRSPEFVHVSGVGYKLADTTSNNKTGPHRRSL